jgi:hypothetical protein
MLRAALLGSLQAATYIYVGIVIVGCIRLGSIHKLPTVAKIAFPWFVECLGILLLGSGLYVCTMLFIAKRGLKGTEFTLTQFMSLPLEERHTLMKTLRRGGNESLNRSREQ